MLKVKTTPLDLHQQQESKWKTYGEKSKWKNISASLIGLNALNRTPFKKSLSIVADVLKLWTFVYNVYLRFPELLIQRTFLTLFCSISSAGSQEHNIRNYICVCQIYNYIRDLPSEKILRCVPWNGGIEH